MFYKMLKSLCMLYMIGRIKCIISQHMHTPYVMCECVRTNLWTCYKNKQYLIQSIFDIILNMKAKFESVSVIKCHQLTSLTKQKVWEWYGKFWAINGPYVEMIWDGWVTIWNWHGTKFCQISGKDSIWEGKLMLSIIWESYGDNK